MSRAGPRLPPVVVDTREQAPWSFPEGIATKRGGLRAGDYSLEGFELAIAVERKSLDDLVGSLTFGRERFKRELAVMRRYWSACLVIEASAIDIVDHAYRSDATPASIIGSCVSIAVDFRLPVFFAHDREIAADIALRFLRLAWDRIQSADRVDAKEGPAC